jgi:hypothetical protein
VRGRVLRSTALQRLAARLDHPSDHAVPPPLHSTRPHRRSLRHTPEPNSSTHESGHITSDKRSTEKMSFQITPSSPF